MSGARNHGGAVLDMCDMKACLIFSWVSYVRSPACSHASPRLTNAFATFKPVDKSAVALGARFFAWSCCSSKTTILLSAFIVWSSCSLLMHLEKGKYLGAHSSSMVVKKSRPGSCSPWIAKPVIFSDWRLILSSLSCGGSFFSLWLHSLFNRSNCNCYGLVTQLAHHGFKAQGWGVESSIHDLLKPSWVKLARLATYCESKVVEAFDVLINQTLDLALTEAYLLAAMFEAGWAFCIRWHGATWWIYVQQRCK